MAFSDAAQAWLLTGVVLVAVLVTEACSYLIVYRRPAWKRACDRVRDLTKKFEKEESKLIPVDKRKAHDRYVSRLEDEVKEATSKMNSLKMRATIFSSVAFFLLYRSVSTSFGGAPVARLPFVPFKMVEALTHRGVVSDDVQDCGFGFIYTLATMAARNNVPRLLGFVAPRSAFDPSKAAARAAAKVDQDTY